MKISATINGREVEVETFPGMFSPEVTRGILAGETYTIVPVLDEVRTVLDVGANLGAASVLFACHYPEATVHAFEPGPATYELLVRNTADFPSIVPHNFGLFDQDDQRPLYRGKGSPGEASIFRHPWVADESDMVEIRDASSWLEEAEIGQIDVLKVDTEGSELPIFRALRAHLSSVQAVYLEFHSKADFRELDAMLSPTHELAGGKLLFENGELMYLQRERYDAFMATVHAHNAAG